MSLPKVRVQELIATTNFTATARFVMVTNILSGKENIRKWNEFGIFLRLTWLLAGKYALIGILCLFRRVRWYVGN